MKIGTLNLEMNKKEDIKFAETLCDDIKTEYYGKLNFNEIINILN